jgi:hypothetical protein
MAVLIATRAPGGRRAHLEIPLNARHIALRHAAAAIAAVTLGAALPARASAHVDVGTAVEDVRLDAIAGGAQPLLGAADVSLLVFFRPGQDRSLDTLRQIAACEKTLAARRVRVVGLVSSSFPRDAVQAFVQQSGFGAPVLVDAGDALYGRFEVRQHPLAVVVGKGRRVAAVQPYLRVNYCEALLAQVRFAVGEIGAEQRDAALQPEKAAMPSDDRAAVAVRHVRLGEKYLAAGSYALATKQFEEALALDPANVRAAEGKRRCAAGAAAPSAE